MNKFIVLCFLLFFSATAFAQFNGNRFSLSVNAVYTTSAKIYLSPNSSDEILRNNSFPLTDIVNPSFELRYRLYDEVIIGLSTEYMEHTEFGKNLTVFSGNNTETIEVEDGFALIPIEFSIHYLMPFSTEKFKFLMGGGGAYYMGKHIRKFGNVEVSNVERKAAFGIQVSIGMEYLVIKNVSIRSEMKFRDPQFTVKSKYSLKQVNYFGRTITLAQETFDSKINVDGVTFIAGLTYQF